MSVRLLAAMAVAAMAVSAPAMGAAPTDPQVVELRQYRLVPGQGDAFVALFDREFVEPQEALGMGLVGQFRDLDDPDRFVWMRSFPDMAGRAGQLQTFYTGPVWKAHRTVANGMMRDSDNVLLLKPAGPGRSFRPSPPRARPGASPAKAGLIVATIYYLWREPTEGFAEAFDAKARPQIEAAGLPVLGQFVPEPTPNNFPALPVRQGERVFVWFTRAESPAAYAAAMKRLAARPAFAAVLKGEVERDPQVLRLTPTPRSALR